MSSLFGGGDSPAPAPAPILLPPPAPVVTPPPTMPVADDQLEKRARRKKLAAMYGKRGRSSTMLTDSGAETLG